MKSVEWIFAITVTSLVGCAQPPVDDASGGDASATRPPSSDAPDASAASDGSTRLPDASERLVDATTPPAADGCEPDVIAAPTGAACAASTLTCLDACTDDACYDGCFAADPACGDCLDDAYLACANAAGCQAAWNALTCCADDCVDDTCYDTTCGAEAMAYDACTVPHDEACWTAEDVCFGP
jgi:hypothetical protein